jgi:hypothetical protein
MGDISMKKLLRFSGLLLLACGLMTEHAGAAQTFAATSQAHATAVGEAIIFSAQSGNFGLVVTDFPGPGGPQEGGMEVYGYSTSCSCWNYIGGGGGVVDDAPGLQSIFGVDSADATVLATKLKAFLATQ